MLAPPNKSSSTTGGASSTTGAPAAHSDSDSDSDWDDDDDFVSRRINIKIKPIAQLAPSTISASVDELRASVGTWKSMANINLVKPNSRRSHYQSTAQLDKLTADSIHLTFDNKVSLADKENNNDFAKLVSQAPLSSSRAPQPPLPPPLPPRVPPRVAPTFFDAPPDKSSPTTGGTSSTTGAPAAHSDSDSDSDWDDDDDFVSRRINIKIKPIAQLTPSKINGSVDELRAVVGTWKSMANINLVKPNSRRSHYQSTAQLDKLTADSIHLTFGNRVSLADKENNNDFARLMSQAPLSSSRAPPPPLPPPLPPRVPPRVAPTFFDASRPCAP